MRTTVSLALSLTAFIALLPSGCASDKPKPPTLQELQSGEIAYIDEIVKEQHGLQMQVVARMEAKYQAALAAGHPNECYFDALALSGGGAKGAFGAGFLVGWGEVTDPAFKRPLFDFVSGVSTGSLIAPMAFVGDDEAYRIANETYRNPKADWVKERGLLNVIFDQQSFYTNDGLFKSICASISPQIPKIAEGAREHRVLVVGAVNLNQGLTRAWNLSELACEVEAGKVAPEAFCRRSLASASIPLVFPPQSIDNNLYVDGSTTSDILLTLDGFRMQPTITERWNQRHPGVPLPKIRIWVIANTTLFPQPMVVTSSDVSVLGRSLDLAVQAGLISDLKVLELFTALFKAQGMEFEFRYVAMPDGYTTTSDAMFDKTDMCAMSDLGMSMGRNPSVWRTQVPNLLVPIGLRNQLQGDIDAAKKAPPQATPASNPSPTPTR